MTRHRPAPILAVVILAIVAAWPWVTATAQTLPSARPTNLAAVSGPGVGEVSLTWTPAANVAAHWVWSVRPDGADNRWHESAADGSAVIDGLEPGQEYWFIVIASRGAPAVGPPRWSGFSNWEKAVALAPPPPPQLDVAGGLTAAPGPNPGEVSLRWRPGDNAVVHWVWSVRADGTESRWHHVDAGSAVIGNLEMDVEYRFAVIAGYRHSSGAGAIRWSDFSNWATSTPQPAAPPPVTVTDAANRIAAGGKHTCMLQPDGTAVCWGANGDADQGQADQPASVVFTAITAGYEHTCALTAAGNARCWGDNGSGQSAAPAGVAFTHIDAGRAHTCAIRADDKTAQCWGSNEYGQRNAPAGVSFTAITAGGDHSCGVRADGRVQCWGDNYYRQSAPPDALFYAVSAGTWHTCGIKRDGSIACWGANPDGQAPAEVEGSYQAISSGKRMTCAVDSSTRGSSCWGYLNAQEYMPSDDPMSVSVGEEHICWLSNSWSNNADFVTCHGSNRYGQSARVFVSTDTYASVSAGQSHTCGVRTDDTVACWGNNDVGEATPPEGVFQSVSAGLFHTCGVRTDGTVSCWGYNIYGQSFPPRVLAKSVDAGGYHTCAVRTDSTVVCWGMTEPGQPTLAPPAETFQSISAGQDYTCGVQTDSTVSCWGYDFRGVTITPPKGSFQSVSAYQSTCGVQTDGAVACWGDSGTGVTIPPEGSFQSVSVGADHACGVRTDGTVSCWGHNSDWQATPPEDTFRSVSAGWGHTCGLRTDGRVVCWGNNEWGQAAPP